MIPITQEECRRLQVSMLKEIDSFCRTNAISYFLAFGTLLGAIRHRGFIPWDDDVDIMMPRKDYEKFMILFPSKGRIRFLTAQNTENYPYAFGKVIDTHTIKIEPLRSKYQVIGLDVDVFPIDNYPEDFEETKRWCHSISVTQKKMNGIFGPFWVPYYTKRKEDMGKKEVR